MYEALYFQFSVNLKDNIRAANGGGRMVRRCWVNCGCRGVLLISMIVGHGLIALAVGAGGLLGHFSRVYHFSFLSPSPGDGPI